MNNFANELNNAISPDYVHKLGISQAPFLDLYNEDFYFENDNKADVLKKISHLLEYTQLTLFLQGAYGAGKTTLIKQRILSAKDNWRICYFNAKDYTSSESMITKISEDMGLTLTDSDSQQPAESIQLQLANLQQNQLLPVLIIDDIEALNPKLIPTLSSLISRNDGENAGIRLIICGEDIPQKLSAIIPNDENNESLKYLPLLPLSEKETTQYIKHRLQITGYTRTAPFTTKTTNKIYNDSKGFPLLINHMASHILSQFARGKIGKKTQFSLEDNDNLKLIAAALGVVVFIAVLIITLSTEDDGTSTTDTVTTESLTIPKQSLFDEAIDEIDLDAQQPDIADNITSHDSIIPTNRQADSTEKPNDTIAEVIEKTPPTAIKTNNRAITYTNTKNRWILSQAKSHYTLQLIGSSHRQSAENFVNKNNLNRDAHIFHTMRKGKDWYSVIYKSFSSYKQAKRATERLPTSLKSSKPWIRSFKQIQNDIQK